MATIDRLVPLPRNQGIQIPGIVNASNWCDAVVLAANTAEAYTLPTDAGGHRASIIGITATGTTPLWVNYDGAAVVPTADTTTGAAPSLLQTQFGFSYLIAVPSGTIAVSFISTGICIVLIECWT
jgi:hypothetical protein